MKKNLILALSLALTSAAFAEGPADDVKAAVKKLADAGNYSWTTSTPGQGDRGGSAVEGKIDKSGVALVSMKFGDQPAREGISKGGKTAVKTDDGWKSGAELSQRPPGGDGGGGGRRGGGGGMMVRMLENLKAPAADAESLATGSKELKKEGDAISGELTEEAVKTRLTFGGGRRGGGGGGGAPPAPANAKGSVKFWIKDGVLSKYEVTVSGTFEFNGNSRDFSRTTTTEIKDAGTTKVEVPAEATAKLEASEAPKKEGDSGEKKPEEKKPEEKKKDEI